MKTLQNTIKITVGVFLLAALAVSCIPEQQSLGGAGQTLVKLWPAGFNVLAVDAKTTTQSGILFEVRRDVHSATAMNSATTVILKYDADTALLKAYNTAHTTSFIPLPPALGSTTPAITAGKITLVFDAGEFVKNIIVNLPSSASFDFSKAYALTFKLFEVTGTGVISEDAGQTIVCQILAKNGYDGVYTVTGTFVDYVTPAWVAAYPKTVELRTTGSNSVSKWDKDYATFGYVFFTDATKATTSSYGAFTPVFSFDASNNVSVSNSTPPSAPRNRRAILYTGAGSINKWVPASKTFDITYQLSQDDVVPVLRNLITEHWVRTGPR